MAVPICSMPCLENLSLVGILIFKAFWRMAPIPPNVENTENFDFFKLGQDCKQVAIEAI